jgi:hypothetical protein
MDEPTSTPRVVVTDVQMRFGSMIVFMIKWAVASIPAFLILLAAGSIFWMVVAGMFLSAIFGTSALSRSQGAHSSSTTSSSRQPETSTEDAEARAYIPKVELVGIKVGDGLTGRGRLLPWT